LKREVEEAIARAGENASAQITQSKDLVREVIDQLGMLFENPGSAIGLPTGFIELDRMTNGLQPAEMNVITGHPGIGKTALAMNIVEHVCLDVGKAVAVFGLGMTSRALMSRLLCSRAKVSLQHLRNGFLSERDFPNLTAAASQLAQAKLHIDDTPRLSMTALLAKTHQLKSEYDIQLVVIDYFQLLRSASRENNRQLEISEISADLKQLAKELNIPVIVVTQLSRQPITGSRAAEGGLPRLSDLWELGSLEQDADMVGLLVRPEYYEPDYEAKTERAGEAELIIAKQRNGPTGYVPLTFLRKYARFETQGIRTGDSQG
jgi:replicative DNA helicase